MVLETSPACQARSSEACWRRGRCPQQSRSSSGRAAGIGCGRPGPSGPRGPRLAQCAGGPGRSARALQPGSDIHWQSQPAAPEADSPRLAAAPEGAPQAGPGPLRQREVPLPGAEGGGRAGGRVCAAAGRRRAPGPWAGSPSVPPTAQLGGGPGRPRGEKVSGPQKWPGLAGGRGEGRGPARPSFSRRQRKGAEGKRGWAGGAGSTDLNRFRLPLPQPPPPAPGKRSGETRTVSSRTARTKLPPPFYFSANVYLNARAHTEIVRLFFPLGRKNEESKRREQSEELLLVGSALCRGRSGAGTRPPPACSLPALRRVSQRGRPRRGRSETFRRSSPHRRRRAARRDRGEVGPAAASPTSPSAPRPAGPRRRAEGGRRRGGGRSRGPGGARSGRPARPPVDAAPGEPGDNFAV